MQIAWVGLSSGTDPFENSGGSSRSESPQSLRDCGRQKESCNLDHPPFAPSPAEWRPSTRTSYSCRGLLGLLSLGFRV